MKRLLPLVILALMALHANAQVGINNISPNASLDISATNQASPASNDGILVPRIDAFPATDPGAAQNSMIVYLTTTDAGNPPGFYFWNQGTLSWESLTSAAGADEINDLTDGINDGSSVFLGDNSGTNDDGNNSNAALGTNALTANTSGRENAALGSSALRSNTTGTDNSALGFQSLNGNTGGYSNVAVGSQAMLSNTTGHSNTALGVTALRNNTTGLGNTAIGFGSLNANTANYNTALGYLSMNTNTTGANNTGLGYFTLRVNTSGSNNTAVGNSAMSTNTTGENNTAMGRQALAVNTTGNDNTVYGNQAGLLNSTGYQNTAMGSASLDRNTIGYNNVSIGYSAMGNNINGRQNTVVGAVAMANNSTGIENTIVGYNAGSGSNSGNYSVAVGSNALSGTVGASGNVAIGRNTLSSVSSSAALYNVGVGYEALESLTTGNRNIGIGSFTLNSATTGIGNVGVGSEVFQDLTTANFNTSLGYQAGSNITTGSSNVSIGYLSGFLNNTGTNNTFIGSGSGRNATGSSNVFIGTNAGLSETGSNLLYIDNSSTTQPLVWGNFTSNDFRIYGNLQVRDPATNGYEFPALDGSSGQVLQTDGSGAISWANISGADEINDLTDGVNDGSSVFLGNTSGANDDGLNQNTGLGSNAVNSNTSGQFNTAIGFSALANTTRASYNVAIGRLAMSGTSTNALIRYNIAVGNLSLSSLTSGSSNVGVGYASLQDVTSGTENTAIGTLSLQNVTTGRENTAVGNGTGIALTTGTENTMMGDDAGSSITTGQRNTLLGNQAGSSLNIGSANVFIGDSAGANETTGSNKLYIDNSSTTTPLIYGDFATNELRVNGELQVGNPATTGFEFPTVDGSANQVLRTNGAGNISWANVSSEWNDAGTYVTPGDGILEDVLIGTTTVADYKMRVASASGGSTTIDLANTAVNTDAMRIDTGNSTGDGLDITMTSAYNLANRSAIEANITYGPTQVDIARYESGGTTYGFKTTLTSTLVGNEYGIYSNVLTANGFAGYFLGDVAIGTTTGNTYTLPASRGTNGQVMTTDGAGNASWTTLSTGESTTASNGLAETGDDVRLGGSLIQATTITQGLYNMIFDLTSSGYFEVQDAGTAKFRVSSTGNTRVGGDLQVNQTSVTGTRLIDLNSAGTTGLVDVYAAGIQTARIAGTGDSYINGGPFGVGITNPQEVLDVVGNTSTAYIGDFYNESTSSLADGISIRLAASNPNASAYYVAFQRAGTTTAGRISGTGTGVQYVTTSDARLKTNFKEVDGALEMISRINPRWYEFKEDLGKQEMGFLAQELQKVYPQAVSGDENSDPTTDPMMVDYSRMTPLLTAGIQELEEKVNALEAENAALKETLKKYEDLEARIAALEGSKNSEDSSPIASAKEE